VILRGQYLAQVRVATLSLGVGVGNHNFDTRKQLQTNHENVLVNYTQSRNKRDAMLKEYTAVNILTYI